MTRPDNVDFEVGFNAQLDRRDNSRIDFLTNELGLAYAEYLRQADEYATDPQPVPHIHTPHDEKVNRCYWTTRVAHGGGLIMASVWAALTASSRAVLACGFAVVIYSILAVTTDFVISSYWPRKKFVERFKWLSAIPYPIAMLSGLAILAERFASGDLAAILAVVDPYAWLAAEASCLWLGAVALTGQDRFAWSRKLKNTYDNLVEQIEDLKHNIERRRAVDQERTLNQPMRARSSPGTTALVILFALGVSLPFRVMAACPAIIADQTGSIANQVQLEERLTKAAAKFVSTCVTIIPVSAHVFSADPYEVTFERTHLVLFDGIQAAVDHKRALSAEKRIGSIFQSHLSPAPCTSVSDMLILALSKTHALVVTDGEHTCGGPIPNLQGVGYISVLIVRSKADEGNDAEIFQKRRNWILHRLPSAHIYPEFQLEQAVRELFAQHSNLASSLE